MNHPRLLLITDHHPDLADRLAAALAGGVRDVLLRAKGLAGRELCQLAQSLLPLVRVAGGRLLIHDRADLAVALSADGVHLPANGLPTGLVRGLLAPHQLLGRSCHQPAEASQALHEGADYVTLSPVFATSSHPDAEPIGLARFSQWRQEIAGPVLALGGIDETNAPAVWQAGADGIAVISAILARPDPRHAARTLILSRR